MTTYYELLTLFSGTLSDDELEQAAMRLRDQTEKLGAKILKHNVWERRRLAYPVDKTRQGAYVVTELELEPAKVAELDRLLHLEKGVLRHQLVKAHRKTEKELEQERRSREARLRQTAREQQAVPEQPAISGKELDEKLAEILTDDMVK